MTRVSVMTRIELLYGLKWFPDDHRLHLTVRQFIKIVRVLALNADATSWYAAILQYTY
ncbi:hypothetical protein [Candidatus Williamhamiltonella defendens]|uniref:hypothetical protein n=1 Tax=Candidatus Williamhamiltonella defendens TaxID=138072 RepID=UPI001C9DD488|nr:hypothetical protein [Candidatus Hamiltonella defensa]